MPKHPFFLFIFSILLSSSFAMATECRDLLTRLNTEYIQLHYTKEQAFWAKKMNLQGFKAEHFEQAETALRTYSSNPEMIAIVENELKKPGLTEEQKVGLTGWLHFFKVNTVASVEAVQLQAELQAAEQKLYHQRFKEFQSGYTNPSDGAFVALPSGSLSNVISTNPSEEVRKAAHTGLLEIEKFVLSHGFAEIVKLRNKLARSLGYKDFYDYKFTTTEGESKDKLFEVFGDLEVKTRTACRAAIDGLIAKHGEQAALPWNRSFYAAGAVEEKLDPYFDFSQAVERWVQSFAALGISYKGATIKIDLVDRPGKYSNGFMHGPVPSLFVDGKFSPAAINFAANAIPGQLGSGKDALGTLFHEGGHAAHFANVCMPGACFSQEFAPTSTSMAETQSMFLDALDHDPQWLARYTTHKDTGEAMPASLIKEYLTEANSFIANKLRSLLAVSLFEKELYEMPDEKITAEGIFALARKSEQQVQMINVGGRPLLAIPHLLSEATSAYYHGYLLAQMAVYQTQDYFLQKYGYIVDNPNVGAELREKYWKPGNVKTFFQFVEALTGKPFSADSTVARVNKSKSELEAEIEKLLQEEKDIPKYTKPIRLNAKIQLVHGDEVIASNANGQGFKKMSRRYGQWVKTR